MKLNFYDYATPAGTAELRPDGEIACSSEGIWSILRHYARKSGLEGEDLMRHVAERVRGVVAAQLVEDEEAAK